MKLEADGRAHFASISNEVLNGNGAAVFFVVITEDNKVHRFWMGSPISLLGAVEMTAHEMRTVGLMPVQGPPETPPQVATVAAAARKVARPNGKKRG